MAMHVNNMIRKTRRAIRLITAIEQNPLDETQQRKMIAEMEINVLQLRKEGIDVSPSEDSLRDALAELLTAKKEAASAE